MYVTYTTIFVPCFIAKCTKCYMCDVSHGWQSNNTLETHQTLLYALYFSILRLLYILHYRMYYDDVTWLIFLQKPATSEFRIILNVKC